MNTQFNSTPSDICMACLSSERTLNFIEDVVCKQMFCGFLDNLELDHIPLCFECMGRLKSVVRFKEQVRKAQKYLKECVEQSKLPSLSKLNMSATVTFLFKPEADNSQETYIVHSNNLKRELRKNHNSSSDESTNDFDYLPDSSNVKQELRAGKSSRTVKDDKQQEDGIWEVKLENPLIKKEPEDSNEVGSGDFDNLEESYKIVTKYDFNDSDDEPLKLKQVKTKKVEKGVKVQKGERPPGVISGVWVQRKLQQLNVPPGQVEMVVLSWEEVELERQKSMISDSYTRHEFRCETCILGFNHRYKLDTHMKKHTLEAGNFECDICKTRFKTQSAINSHRRRHRSRWRCSQCHALFSRAAIAADHYARAHDAPHPTHKCHVCDFKATYVCISLVQLRIHVRSHAERQHCDQCGKTFTDKSSLRTHLYIHTNQKDFSCEVCEKKFRFKKALEIHRVRHEAPELLYCRECDKNFKNRLSFYQHINYSMKHINPDKVKHACEFCPRRFLTPTRLLAHRHSMHLKMAPHHCTVDGCTFASASRPALRTHTRMLHRGKRRERNHVCHTCGKAYTTKKILEGHIRSHTGERPFVCGRCPATFSHDAALYNHNKLVHKVPFVRRKPKVNAPPE